MSTTRRVVVFLATGFGAGRARVAPGTFGTLVAVPAYWALQDLSLAAYAAVVAAMFAVGVWLCGVAQRELGSHDPASVVWDEIVGYLVTMFAAPAGWFWVVLGFLLFRLFDIWKPFPLRLVERRLAGGWGIMADDVLAGVYAAALLHLWRLTGMYP